MFPLHPSRRTDRRGTITILAAILSIVLLGMVAFAVDIGYVLSAKEEMQRAADSAALAAAWEYGKRVSDGFHPADAQVAARGVAGEYAMVNKVGKAGSEIASNPANSPSGDLVFGYINDFSNPNAVFDTQSADRFNAVRVRVRRDPEVNGQLPLFFARVFGRNGQSAQAQATAAILRDVKGFRIPSDGSNLDLLPFTLDWPTWTAWRAGEGTDKWTWNPETKSISPGPDGHPEVNLYPQGTGSPGNRGMVDIGSSNNSTKDIARQILYGVSPADLAYLGGSIEFNSEGKLYLNGDTGISAGVKDELAAIRGQPRTIPIFTAVHGPGNNAVYTIEAWQGVRIMDVKLTGPMNQKHLTIQMAPSVGRGMIPSETAGTSHFVYSPAILIE